MAILLIFASSGRKNILPRNFLKVESLKYFFSFDKIFYLDTLGRKNIPLRNVLKVESLK
jgi:hypothetical protein